MKKAFLFCALAVLALLIIACGPKPDMPSDPDAPGQVPSIDGRPGGEVPESPQGADLPQTAEDTGAEIDSIADELDTISSDDLEDLDSGLDEVDGLIQ